MVIGRKSNKIFFPPPKPPTKKLNEQHASMATWNTCAIDRVITIPPKKKTVSSLKPLKIIETKDDPPEYNV